MCVCLQAATANEGDDLQKAQQHHKRAQFFNIGAASTLISIGIAFLTTYFVVTYIYANLAVASN